MAILPDVHRDDWEAERRDQAHDNAKKSPTVVTADAFRRSKESDQTIASDTITLWKPEQLRGVDLSRRAIFILCVVLAADASGGVGYTRIQGEVATAVELIPTASLYPLVANLVQMGLLSKTEVQGDYGRPRHILTITHSGRRALELSRLVGKTLTVPPTDGVAPPVSTPTTRGDDAMG